MMITIKWLTKSLKTRKTWFDFDETLEPFLKTEFSFFHNNLFSKTIFFFIKNLCVFPSKDKKLKSLIILSMFGQRYKDKTFGCIFRFRSVLTAFQLTILAHSTTLTTRSCLQLVTDLVSLSRKKNAWDFHVGVWLRRQTVYRTRHGDAHVSSKRLKTPFIYKFNCAIELFTRPHQRIDRARPSAIYTQIQTVFVDDDAQLKPFKFDFSSRARFRESRGQGRTAAVLRGPAAG